MSGFGLILTAGDKHSRANADKIRAWRKHSDQRPPRDFTLFVRDYERRGFLAKGDADALVAEFAA